MSDWRKDCSRVAGSCKSHFRGIKQYHLLAIVRSRIFKNGAHALNGASNFGMISGSPGARSSTAFLKVLTAITILPLAVSIASSLAGPAFGVSFNVGEIEGQFDSSLSIGASWSTQSPNKNLIGVNNGGHGLSQTSDDGHANFKSGETFSKIFKGIHDLELKYGDTGVFVRGKYWYDNNRNFENFGE